MSVCEDQRRTTDDRRRKTKDEGPRTSYDLLTVVLHEFGHVLEYGHDDGVEPAPLLEGEALVSDLLEEDLLEGEGRPPRARARHRHESEGGQRGEIRGDIPAQDLVIMLFAMMDGLQVQWLYEPEQIKMARLFEQFIVLLRGK